VPQHIVVLCVNRSVTSAAFGDGGIQMLLPKIIVRLFIGLSFAATSVYSFEHRSDRSPTVA
jgi:hypothetical protein